MPKPTPLIQSAATILRIVQAANWLLLAAITAGLAATLLRPTFFTAILTPTTPPQDLPAALTGVRLLMLVGIAMAIATASLLAPLAAVVQTARSTDPFIAANAPRLRQIGWALLALQLLDIPCTLLAWYWLSLGSAAPAPGGSAAGWLATLMAFVLAQVFTAGAAMREDLSGTV